MAKKTKPKGKANAKKNSRPNRRSNAKPSDKQSDNSTAGRSNNPGVRRPQRGTAGRDKDVVGTTPVEPKRVPRIREIEVQRFSRKKMKMVTKAITIPKWEYEDLVKEVARLLDVFGTGITRKPDILALYKIAPEMLTPQVLSDADRRLHILNEKTALWIAKRGGELNGKRLYIEPKTGEITTISPEIARLKQEQAARAAAKAAENRPADDAKPEASKEPKGPSNKETVFRAWYDGEDSIPTLHDMVEGRVLASTIKGWIKQWLKGENLPAFARKEQLPPRKTEKNKKKGKGFKIKRTKKKKKPAPKAKWSVADFRSKKTSKKTKGKK